MSSDPFQAGTGGHGRQNPRGPRRMRRERGDGGSRARGVEGRQPGGPGGCTLPGPQPAAIGRWALSPRSSSDRPCHRQIRPCLNRNGRPEPVRWRTIALGRTVVVEPCGGRRRPLRSSSRHGDKAWGDRPGGDDDRARPRLWGPAAAFGPAGPHRRRRRRRAARGGPPGTAADPGGPLALLTASGAAVRSAAAEASVPGRQGGRAIGRIAPRGAPRPPVEPCVTHLRPAGGGRSGWRP
ncbi:MAG: hypothetical protein QOH43_3563 [Solirubrobacteraceae bacterium]|jgi:hypothetical protein|nr:hypothetical protein [Solirubrobacteraceae bacterium]